MKYKKTYVGYYRVVGITTTVNIYTDIYCNLVSCTEVLNAAAEGRGLIHVCYWYHTSSVDQSMVGVERLVRDVRRRTA